MEKKINIAELLKDCPSGMELDCSSYDNVSFDKISDDKNSTYPIFCYITDKEGNRSGISFTENGCESKRYGAKCVIFPKGKTTWEGFVPPCKFKDGDILADANGNIAIYKGMILYNKKLAYYYCGYRRVDNAFIVKNDKDSYFGHIEDYHYATEEEKKKLFQAIKDNGYKWNSETKTLDKLIEPRFEVWNTIRNKKDKTIHTIKYIYHDSYGLCDGHILLFREQDNYELAPNKFDINTLVPFESSVLVRDTEGEKWKPAIWGYYDVDNIAGYPYETVGGNCFCFCIPYEGNEHLLSTKDDCADFYKIW